MNDADEKAFEAWANKAGYVDLEYAHEGMIVGRYYSEVAYDGWKAACEWRDSHVGEPVAFTNAYQLAFLKDPKYSSTPMAMWAKPFNEAAIALYLRQPPAQINQQLAALLGKSLHWLDGLCDAGPLGQQYPSDELTQFVDEIKAALNAAKSGDA